MFFATIMQGLEFVRKVFDSQDAAGAVPPPTEKRAAMLQGTFRPPRGCNPAQGPVPCADSIIAILTQDPAPGCLNVTRGK